MADDSSEAAQRRSRLRWLTLAEILGVAALVISALTLWNNYSERRHGEDAHAAEDRAASARARTLVLRATIEDDGKRLALRPAGDQVIQSQTISFPKALAIDPVDSTDPRIEASWFARPLEKAREAAGGGERRRGDARLPVAIATRFLVGGELAEDVAIYDIGYAVEHGFLGGGSIRLRGLSLVARGKAGSAQARLDTLWKARHVGK
jgi:hypothetical protein